MSLSRLSGRVRESVPESKRLRYAEQGLALPPRPRSAAHPVWGWRATMDRGGRKLELALVTANYGGILHRARDRAIT